MQLRFFFLKKTKLQQKKTNLENKTCYQWWKYYLFSFSNPVIKSQLQKLFLKENNKGTWIYSFVKELSFNLPKLFLNVSPSIEKP